MNIPTKHHFSYSSQDSMRVDKFLSTVLTNFSRSLLSQWIKKGCLTINEAVITQPKTALKEGDQIIISFPENYRQDIHITPQQEEVMISYESEHFMIINKDANVVVHPGAGVQDGTLVNFLAATHPEITSLPNWGLIHRLDKDTTGLLIVAKSEVAYQGLNQMMLNREITRLYQAIIHGHLQYSRTIETGISRCHHNRLKRAVSHSEHAKQAITHITIVKHFEQYTHIQCKLETGRTHQIRVHCEHIGHPILGDTLYKGRLNNNKKFISRQALHAYNLQFICPITKKEINVTSDLPSDIHQLLEID